jgi:hypothetical protein
MLPKTSLSVVWTFGPLGVNKVHLGLKRRVWFRNCMEYFDRLGPRKFGAKMVLHMR